jgi:lysophospholipase L1-like esterase
MLAAGGKTVALCAAEIDAELATRTDVPDHVLINLGANDADDGVTEGDWKTGYAYILDAVHAKWPNANIYLMRPWRRDNDAVCDDFATWIADIIADGRSSWAFEGPDERVFLENGDNGTTYTTDGTHPTAAGYTLTAEQWVSVIDPA